MARFSHISRAPNTCGVGVVSVFRKSAGQPIAELQNPGGCGWLIAGFVSNSVNAEDHGVDAGCTQEAYEELKKKFKMMDQYPVRVNDNSENKFFFVIYDTKSKLGPVGRAQHNAQFNWPL